MTAARAFLHRQPGEHVQVSACRRIWSTARSTWYRRWSWSAFCSTASTACSVAVGAGEAVEQAGPALFGYSGSAVFDPDLHPVIGAGDADCSWRRRTWILL
jgi:predicted small secreted protein